MCYFICGYFLGQADAFPVYTAQAGRYPGDNVGLLVGSALYLAFSECCCDLCDIFLRTWGSMW